MIGELHFLTAAEASRLIQSRQLSPVELVEAFLRRIEAVDGAVHSYITVLGEQASEAARAAEREIAAGEYRGALHGIPYGLKDIIHVAGIPTTACSRLMLDYRPAASATIALKLQAAGAILLGKLNTYEFGSGMAEDALELPFPPARNPWNLAHFTGGSSTGCGAAVAAGTAMIAIGADTGGSVRLPAAGCGLVGLKPTYGLVSRAGILPNSFTLDCVGPLAWTVEDAAMTLRGVGVAGHDVLDPASADTDIPDYRATLGAGIAGLRVGIVRRFHEIDHPADPEVAAAFEESVRVFRALGAQVVEIDFPASQQNFLDCLRLISASEFYSLHEPYFLARRGEMGAAVRDKLAMGASVSASDYLRAQRWRREFAATVDAAFARCDFFLCAGTLRAAPRLDDPAAVAAFSSASAMSPFSLTGHPAIAVCNGFSESGLPLNIQIVGPYFGEAVLLRAAAAHERATDWRRRRPLLIPNGGAAPAATPPFARQTDADYAPEFRDDARKLMKRLGIENIPEAEMSIIAAQYADARDLVSRMKRRLEPELEPLTIFRPKPAKNRE
jgi:aspartyl-tRNA(Asn)/glutamyl-tRNA(Gln) amidotransferase subunit A